MGAMRWVAYGALVCGVADAGELDAIFGDGFDDPSLPAECGSILPPAGYASNPNYVSFDDEFPSTGTDPVALTTPVDQYVSIRFVAPPEGSPLYPDPAGGRFGFAEAQIGGDVNFNAIYIGISRCPGDFRVPTTSAPAPADDPTFANGCRNIRFANGNPDTASLALRRIDYRTGLATSTSSACQITPEGAYYFNLILADPRSGIAPPATDGQCGNPAGCGVQLSIE